MTTFLAEAFRGVARRLRQPNTDDNTTLTPPTGHADPLARELAGLRDLDLAGLRQHWRRLMRQDAPAHLTRTVLFGILAYRVQADAQGGLDRETQRFLDRVAEQRAAGHVKPVPAVEDRRVGRLKPGTMLVREHGGTLCRVMVMADGYAWNGTTYDSLSAVARAITGTNWNGPRFFGLRDRAGGKTTGLAAKPATEPLSVSARPSAKSAARLPRASQGRAHP